MKIEVNCSSKSYPIILERGAIHHLNEVVNTDCKALILTDSGVPSDYSQTVAAQFRQGFIHTVEQGEQAKSFPVYEQCLEKMLELHFTRKDKVIAVGGGVVGDLAGFVAATYMRGIDFINIPTTTLAQIDSSVGGKVAINVKGIKNCVGAFWQPKAVIIDLDTNKTLNERLYNAGMMEALKAGLIQDASLYELFKTDSLHEVEDTIIEKALMVKKKVVEEDETEQGLRKILNFGHTFGHGFESYYGLHDYYHGECVAVGMMTVLEDENLKQEVGQILQRLHIPTSLPTDPEILFQHITSDKKRHDDSITLVKVDQVGQAYLQDIPLQEIKRMCEDLQ